MASVVDILENIQETFEATFHDRAAPADQIRIALSMQTFLDGNEDEIAGVLVFIAVSGETESQEVTCTARVPASVLTTDEAVFSFADTLWDMIQSRRMAKVFHDMGLDDSVVTGEEPDEDS